MRAADKRWVRITIAGLAPLAVLVLGFLVLAGRGWAARPEGVGALEYRAPLHEQLSISADEFSAAAEVEANEDVIVAVWTEGDPTSGTASNPNGNVEMMYKWGSGAWRRLTLLNYVAGGDKGYDHALALGGDVAHVVWAIKTAGDDPYYEIYHLAWNLRQNTCQRDSNLSVTTCRERVSKSNNRSKTHPDVAVDGNGVPHVVWAEQTQEAVPAWHIYYDNRNGLGGTWSDPMGDTDQRVSSLSPVGHNYQPAHPVIAADEQHVYITWDLDDRDTECPSNRSGIRFRLRTAITGTANMVLWDPVLTKEGKRLSTVPGARCGGEWEATEFYGWPTVDVNQGHAYVMWQYLLDGEALGVYNVYTHSLQYRVFTGFGGGEQAWWPSIDSQAPELPDEMDWEFASLYAETAEHAYYSGLRPSIEVVGSGGVITPHVVWHAWAPPVSSGGGGGDELAAAQGISPLSEELYVTEDWPYQVFYAYGGYSSPGDLGSITWVANPITVTVGQRDRILCWPDLAVVSYDGGQSYYLHLALHQRSSDATVIKTAWYTNLDASYWLQLPAIFKLHSSD